MAYTLFQELFPETMLTETRTVTVPAGNSLLPADEYGLLEAYCDEEDCDCRRVFFNVISRRRNDLVAVVAYGWESEAFYRKWYGEPDNEIERLAIQEMRGLVLNDASPQSELAPAILKLVAHLLTDPAYEARIKRHYQIFKEKVDPKHFRKSSVTKRADITKPKSKKRKRN
ncbi:MAG: hypothetical protein Q8L87_08135 [Anaerolineales bacterium]|jgi:hypothetical protein|nr:hypothetical protein [Anaerolineales bacterium]